MSYSSHGETVSIGVKAHVLYSQLLTSDEYWALLGSDTVGEIADKLRGTMYADALLTLPPEPRRYDLEGALRMSLLKQAESFLIHLSNPRDAFFRCWIAWYEAENLKSIFRHIAAGRTDRDSLRRRLYNVPGSKLSYENLLTARDFSELNDALKDTPYQKVLAEPFRRLMSGEERTLFPAEMAVDNFVELNQFRKMKKLSPKEQGMVVPLFGTWVDLLNLYTLYRAKAFYAMTPEETLNRLLPVRYRVSLAFLKEAVRYESLERLADMVQANFPVYGGLISDVIKKGESELILERNIKRHMYMQALKTFGNGPPGFHTAMSYFILREYEISDLIRIIEDVRYGYDRRNAAVYLIRPIITGGETEWQ